MNTKNSGVYSAKVTTIKSRSLIVCRHCGTPCGLFCAPAGGDGAAACCWPGPAGPVSGPPLPRYILEVSEVMPLTAQPVQPAALTEAPMPPVSTSFSVTVGSKRQHNQRGSKRQHNRSGSKCQHNQRGSKRQHNRSGSKRQHNRSGSKRQHNQSGSKRQHNRSGSKRQHNRSGSKRQHNRSGSKRQHNRSGSKRQHNRSGSKRQHSGQIVLQMAIGLESMREHSC